MGKKEQKTAERQLSEGVSEGIFDAFLDAFSMPCLMPFLMPFGGLLGGARLSALIYVESCARILQTIRGLAQLRWARVDDEGGCTCTT